MASLIPNNTKELLLNGGFDLDSDTLKVMLVTSSYTPNADTDDFITDASGAEVSGTGYTAGGATLSGVSITQDDTNNLAYLDAADVSWPTSTITNARYAVIYKDTGVPATSPILAVIDFGSNKTSSADTFLITWSSSGIISLA